MHSIYYQPTLIIIRRIICRIRLLQLCLLLKSRSCQHQEKAIVEGHVQLYKISGAKSKEQKTFSRALRNGGSISLKPFIAYDMKKKILVCHALELKGLTQLWFVIILPRNKISSGSLFHCALLLQLVPEPM